MSKDPRHMAYDPVMGKEICDIISTTSLGITKICETHKNFPHHDIIYRWMNESTDFDAMYARAKVKQSELLAHEILEIADDPESRENYNQARLRIDARKWLAAKLQPKRWGDNNKTVENAVKSAVETLLMHAKQSKLTDESGETIEHDTNDS